MGYHYEPATMANINPRSMDTLISSALEGYNKGAEAKYKHKSLEADIFAKKFGPLAQLAASPAFMAMNPTQKNKFWVTCLNHCKVKVAEAIKAVECLADLEKK